METIYPSKIDTWFWAVVVGAAVAVLVAAYYVIKLKGLVGAVAILPALVLGIGLPLWLAVTTRYTLTATDLFIRSGPVSLVVPVAEITGITPTSNPLSSPALSLDRLRIDYGQGKSVMISPKDKQQFLSDVEARRGALAR